MVLEAATKGWFDLVRDTLRDPMLWFLMGSSVLFAFVRLRGTRRCRVVIQQGSPP